MSPFFEWLLIGWSLLAAGWWGIAIWLVSRGRRRALVRRGDVPLEIERKLPTLSIFKPIAGLQNDVPSPQLIAALESFINGLHQPYIAFLNKVQKGEPPIGIFFRYADHEP